MSTGKNLIPREWSLLSLRWIFLWVISCKKWFQCSFFLSTTGGIISFQIFLSYIIFFIALFTSVFHYTLRNINCDYPSDLSCHEEVLVWNLFMIFFVSLNFAVKFFLFVFLISVNRVHRDFITSFIPLSLIITLTLHISLSFPWIRLFPTHFFYIHIIFFLLLILFSSLFKKNDKFF